MAALDNPLVSVTRWGTLRFVALHVLFSKPFCLGMVSHSYTFPANASAVVMDSAPKRAESPGAGLRMA